MKDKKDVNEEIEKSDKRPLWKGGTFKFRLNCRSREGLGEIQSLLEFNDIKNDSEDGYEIAGYYGIAIFGGKRYKILSKWKYEQLQCREGIFDFRYSRVVLPNVTNDKRKPSNGDEQLKQNEQVFGSLSDSNSRDGRKFHINGDVEFSKHKQDKRFELVKSIASSMSINLEAISGLKWVSENSVKLADMIIEEMNKPKQ